MSSSEEKRSTQGQGNNKKGQQSSKESQGTESRQGREGAGATSFSYEYTMPGSTASGAQRSGAQGMAGQPPSSMYSGPTMSFTYGRPSGFSFVPAQQPGMYGIPSAGASMAGTATRQLWIQDHVQGSVMELENMV